MQIRCIVLEHILLRIPVRVRLHIKTSVFVNLKRSESKELNHVPPSVYVLLLTRKQGQTSQLNDFYLGCSKTETV